MFGLFKKKVKEWPFDQPKNCAVFTIKQVIESKFPILLVYHDLEDNGWQFVSNVEFSMEDAKLVSLEEITKIDPTVCEVAKIEPGYHAWRTDTGSKWHVEKTPDESD